MSESAIVLICLLVFFSIASWAFAWMIVRIAKIETDCVNKYIDSAKDRT